MCNGATLRVLKGYEESIECYDEATSIDPDFLCCAQARVAHLGAFAAATTSRRYGFVGSCAWAPRRMIQRVSQIRVLTTAGPGAWSWAHADRRLV